MLNPITAMQSYIPPLWEWVDTDYDTTPEFVEGELIEFDSWDCQRNENGEVIRGYEGCGIIKRITIAEFLNEETGTFEKLPCAIVVPATTNDWLDYVPLTKIDPLSLDHYVELFEAEYGFLSRISEMLVRHCVGYRMSHYSRIGGGNNGNSNMPPVQLSNYIVSLQVNTGASA